MSPRADPRPQQEAGEISGLNGSVVRVTAADAAVFARCGAAGRPAARLVWSVLMDDPGCLRASPDPHHDTRCDSPSTRFHAGHCGGRGVPRGSRPRPCRFRRQVSWWRALRAWGTPGQDCPSADMSPRATVWRLHAREPPVPAQCGLFTATKPSSRLGTRHIVQMQRGGPVAPLPVRHPGPRVTAAGCCTPAPSGLATTAAQSGQRHASYHPPRPVMSAARDKMLSTPCRARLRAARHYRIPACSAGTPHRECDVLRRGRPAVTGRCASDRPPDELRHGADHRLVGAGHLHVAPAGVRRPRPARRDAMCGRDADEPAPQVLRTNDIDAAGSVAAAGRPPSRERIAMSAARAPRADGRKRLARSGAADGVPERGAAAAPHRRHHGESDMDPQIIERGLTKNS